jgi:glutathione synthase/RimK-type ligase-like ATP-grasp enzyme
MARRILILTEANDIHAIAVAQALEQKGAEVTLWATSDFPSCSDESVHYDAVGRKGIRIRGADLCLENPVFDTVWRRRPAYVVDRASLHPADWAFAADECGMFRRSLLHLIAQDAFWVNPIRGAALAGSKLLQHEAAVKVGFRMPETIFTNSPEEIRQFLARGYEVIYKPLAGGGWQNKDAQFLTYTSVLTEGNLVGDDVLRQTPGIFQELIPKAYELRVTVMGRHTLAAKVLSQKTEKGKVDWRRSNDELQFEPAHLPPEVELRCAALLDELGLVFGCFDFIVTPEDDYVFLEVNEMGQFLFIERCCGLPLLDAFSEFLLQGKVDFQWNQDAVGVRYTDSDFEASALARFKEFQVRHRSVPETLVSEE